MTSHKGARAHERILVVCCASASDPSPMPHNGGKGFQSIHPSIHPTMSRSSRPCVHLLAVAVVVFGRLLLLDGTVVVHGFSATAQSPPLRRRTFTTTTARYYHSTTRSNKLMPMPWQQSPSFSTSFTLGKSTRRSRLASSRTTAENDTTLIVNGATGTFYNTTTTIAAADDDDLPVVANALTVKESEEKGQPVTGPRMVQARKYASYFCNLFPLWTVLTAGTALLKPSIFLSVPKSTFPTQIGLLMLCMGITLKPVDFQRVVQRPLAVLLAFAGCYGLVRLRWMVFVACCCCRCCRIYLGVYLSLCISHQSIRNE
jgi:hypothetical protein